MNDGYLSQLRRALSMLALMTVLTGGAYPLAVTLLGQAAFPRQARGSLVRDGDRIVGSALIGQSFAAPGYFRSRPSAAGKGYDAAVSSGSNLGPVNPALLEAVKARIESVRLGSDPGRPVPVDLVTGSGSGLDPHISPAAAFYQAPRVARARGLDEEAVVELIRRHVEGRSFGFLGEPRVNVLLLNLSLDHPTEEQYNAP